MLASRSRALSLLAMAPAALLLAAGGTSADGPSPTTTTLTATPPTAQVGKPVTFTATVAQSSGTPAGVVDFMSDGSMIPCTQVPLHAAGSALQATCTTRFNQSGTHPVQASYEGSPSSFGSSATLQYTATRAPVNVSLTSSSAETVPGVTVLYTATFSPAAADSVPFTGNAEFLDGGTPISGCRTAGVGTTPGHKAFTAECQPTYRAVGTHTIVVRYLGDDHYAPGDSPPLTERVRAPGRGRLTPCAGQDRPFSTARVKAARAAIACVLNRVRARFGLNPLRETAALDANAQRHPGRPSLRGLQVAAVLFDADGDRTPYAVVARWMRNPSLCSSVLADATDLGVGATGRPVIPSPPAKGMTAFAAPPSWTALLVLNGLGAISRPRCPSPLPVDAAGQGAPKGPAGDFALLSAAARNGAIVLTVAGESSRPARAAVAVRFAGATRRLTLSGIGRGQLRQVTVAFGAARVRRAPHGLVAATFTERSPRRVVFLWETRP
jgi:hypothetical protein